MAARRPRTITFATPETYKYTESPNPNDGFQNAIRGTSNLGPIPAEPLYGPPQIQHHPQHYPPPISSFPSASSPIQHSGGYHPPPTAIFTPPNMLPEEPIEGRHSPPQSTPISAAAPNLILGMHPVQAMRLCLCLVFGLLLVLFTIVLLYALLSRDSHHHMEGTLADSASALSPPAMILAHGLTQDSNWKEFVFNFTTTNALYEEQRYPPLGGSLTEFVEDFTFNDVLTDYNVCCMHQELRLVCISRGAAFNHGNYLIDGEVDWDVGSEEVFLRLLVNSEQLLGVECFMTGRYFKP